MLLLWISAALAAPMPVVALGDGLVAVPQASTSASGPPPAAPWTSALADCLEEREPGRWTVLDRAVDGDTAAAARARVGAVRGLEPKLVLVGVGAQELRDPAADPAAFRAELAGLVGELRAFAPRVMLVGVLPPTIDAAAQAPADERTAAWNRVIADVASADPAVRHLDLQADWPRSAEDRHRLTVEAHRLSPQGHVRVAAAVCDAVVGWDP